MLGSFSEEALKVLDFVRCERPDGTAYGTAGTCRKGVESAIEIKKYSWGSTMKVSGGGESVVLLDENQSAIGKLADGESTTFKSDAGDKWTATRDGDTVELKSSFAKLTVNRSRFGQDEPEEAPKPKAEPKAEEAPKSSPKKPREESFEKGGTFEGDSSKLTGGPGVDAIKRQIDHAKMVMEKYPDMADSMKGELEKNLKQLEPFQNSQRVLDSIVSNVPAGTKVSITPMGMIKTEFTTPGGNVVSTTFGRNSFNFEVNGTYEAGTVTQGRKEEMAVARQVQRCFNAVLGSLPEGYVMRTYAYSEDGKGASRQRAYEKMGFSKATPGENIYGRLKDGVLVPSTKEEQSKTDTFLSFSEVVGPNSLALWYVAIFGKDPRVKPS
jgi:hypothetical protein